MQSYEIGSLSLTTNGETQMDYNREEKNHQNLMTYEESQDDKQDFNTGGTDHFALKVLKSLEPEIIKDPPTTDRRAGT